MNLILTLTSILIIGLSLLPAQAYAMSNTYYVTPTGNASDPDCSGGGAPNCAGAYDMSDFNALSGDYSDDVFYFTGTFSTRVDNDGITATKDHPVTLDGYYAGNCDPINAVCSSSALLQQGMNIGSNSGGPDYVTIQDFRMTKTSANSNACLVIFPDVSESDGSGWSEGITIRRNYVYETRATAVAVLRSKYVTIEDNKFTHFGQGYDATQGVNFITIEDLVVRRNVIGHDDDTYPSSCTSANDIELHGIQRGLIEYNEIYGAPNNSGIAVKEDGYSPYSGDNDDIIIRFNHIHDNHSRTGGGEQSGKGVHIVTKPYQSVNNIFVHENFMYNNYIANVQVSAGTNIHIWSNILINSNRNGIFCYIKDANAPVDGVYIYNNTIARNNTSGDTNGARGGITVASGTNVNIKNNLFWNNRPGGEGSKYNQIFASDSISSLEFNTYYHSSSTPNFYYDGGFKSLDSMQNTYNKEDDPPAGEIADPGFIDPDGPDNIYGTADDNYRLDGTYINTGADLSQCFDVSVQGKIYHLCYGDALDPQNTDWSTTPPTVRTAKQGDHDSWERGAYVYKGSTDPPPPPHSLRFTN